MSGKPAARLGDAVACLKCGSTALVQGSADVTFDGLPAATLGHACGCGAALSAAVIPNVLINGRPAAVLGSLTSHGGVVVGGSGTVIIGLNAGGAAKAACASQAGTTGLAPGQGKPAALRDRERQGIEAPAKHPEGAPGARDEVAEQAERPLEQRIILRIGVFFDGTGNNLFNAATGAACRAEEQGFRQDQARSIARHCEKFMLNADGSYAGAETNIARLYRLYESDVDRKLDKSEVRSSISVYIEGIGTQAGQPDNLFSMGTGVGKSGVLACVQNSLQPSRIATINSSVVIPTLSSRRLNSIFLASVEGRRRRGILQMKYSRPMVVLPPQDYCRVLPGSAPRYDSTLSACSIPWRQSPIPCAVTSAQPMQSIRGFAGWLRAQSCAIGSAARVSPQFRPDQRGARA